MLQSIKCVIVMSENNTQTLIYKYFIAKNF